MKLLCSETNAITIPSLISGEGSAFLTGAEFQEGNPQPYEGLGFKLKPIKWKRKYNRDRVKRKWISNLRWLTKKMLFLWWVSIVFQISPTRL